MSRSLLHVLGWRLLAFTFFVLLSAALGAGEARAGNCVAMNFTFNLGSANPNTCDTTTSLNSTAGIGLDVLDQTPDAIAIRGRATAATGAGIGVRGFANSSSANTYGAVGQIGSTTPGLNSAGVLGAANSTTADGPGVWGVQAASGTAPGVLGQTLSTTPGSVGVKGLGGTCSICLGVLGSVPGNGIGVRGEALGSGNGWGLDGTGGDSGIGAFGHTPPASTLSYGVVGISGSSATDAAGVTGKINSNAANAAGVRGDNNSATCCGMGVAGFHAGQGIGVYGEAPNGFGVSGYSPNNWSGYFQGSVNVVGTLLKSSGAFRIDNPLDPAHSYLQHSFVESPDMKNIYDGTVRTNAKGFATVKLPAYFQALNTDFRYQLTILGRAPWDTQARVWNEIKNNRFTVRTSRPNVKVSWQVTGIRHDAWANAHRIQVVVPKTGSADNKYVHPGLYGKPLTKSVVVLPGMDATTRYKFKAPASPALPRQR
jgi:hypothetical protein